MGKRIVVIGGGPGGYVAAISAAQRGASVVLVEKEKLGGTCLNVGCIPTKVLSHSAELFQCLSKEGSTLGIFAEGVRLDWPTLKNRKDNVVTYLVESVGWLLQSNGVEVVSGQAELVEAGKVRVNDRVLDADAVIVATGSEPIIPAISGMDAPGVVTSTEALSFENLPDSMAVLGGGVVGAEFASIYASLGVRTTVIEMMPQLLPGIDLEVSETLRESLVEKGVAFFLNSRLKEAAPHGGRLRLGLESPSGAQEIDAATLLVATGRRASTRGLGLEALGVALEKGRILTDERMRTNVAGIYAVGDCTSRIQLAHVASRESEVAVQNIFGENVTMDYSAVPSVIYSAPQVASVGLTEKEASDAGYGVKAGRFPLMGNGKSILTGHTEGMVKIVSESREDKVLGVHILGGPAGEMIAEGTLAVRLGLSVRELLSTLHAHPTVSEAMGEAAMQVSGHAIHLPKM